MPISTAAQPPHQPDRRRRGRRAPGIGGQGTRREQPRRGRAGVVQIDIVAGGQQADPRFVTTATVSRGTNSRWRSIGHATSKIARASKTWRRSCRSAFAARRCRALPRSRVCHADVAASRRRRRLGRRCRGRGDQRADGPPRIRRARPSRSMTCSTTRRRAVVFMRTEKHRVQPHREMAAPTCAVTSGTSPSSSYPQPAHGVTAAARRRTRDAGCTKTPTGARSAATPFAEQVPCTSSAKLEGIALSRAADCIADVQPQRSRTCSSGSLMAVQHQRSSTLAHAARHAYRDVLFHGRYPAYVLSAEPWIRRPPSTPTRIRPSTKFASAIRAPRARCRGPVAIEVALAGYAPRRSRSARRYR